LREVINNCTLEKVKVLSFLKLGGKLLNTKVVKSVMNAASIFGIIGTIILCIYFYHLGIFQNQHALESLVGNRVVLGPLLFILIQIIQVVVPIIPGGISTAAGVLIFGPVQGFIYNYVGIVVGSLILFSLGRKFGQPFVESLISEKTYNKYIGKLSDSKKWDVLFTILIFSPVAPDDALVLLNSLTKMSFKKFSVIILLGKPLSILAYSFALVYGGQFLTNWLF
jgi:uncharacterized membrane protein YdjX (TVP38/TMEM64 family)